MSISIMTAAWQLDMPCGEKIVLLSLADNANDSGHCWPSMAQIAKRCGMTERGAQLIIQRLVAGGHLTRKEVIGRGCNYMVHPGGPPNDVRPERGSPTPERRSPTPERRSDKSSRTTINHQPTATPSVDAGAPAKKPIAHHLPDDWQPADLTGATAVMVSRWQPGELERQLSKFRDHWAAAGGQAARKRDWQAAWRTWIANHDEWRSGNGRSGGGIRHAHVDDGGFRNPLARAAAEDSAQRGFGI